MENIKIKIVNENDSEDLLKIYSPYVKNTAVTFEYTVPTISEFAGRIRRVLKRYPYLAAVKNGEIVGYAYADVFNKRAAYDWVVETSVYVKQGSIKSGIGGRLYKALENILIEQNVVNLNACIAYSEVPDEYLTSNSVEFHNHLGYKMVGEFHQCGYKFSRWYNMVWMEKHIGIHAVNQPSVKTFDAVREKISDVYGIK